MKKELQELYRASGGDRFGISLDEFVEALDDLSRGQLRTDAEPLERLKFYRSLHVNDLVLVRACLKGNEDAWAFFVSRYQTKLFIIASQITKEESTARDLADSLFADLFGVGPAAQEQYSPKLRSYGGRSSLEGWLRAVLAQEFVNRLRRERRFLSFDEVKESEKSFNFYTARKDHSSALARALDQALSELKAKERFLLAGYFLDGRTKVELARMLSVHESTAGRQIETALKKVRQKTIRHLCHAGLTLNTAREMLKEDVRTLDLDIRHRLLADEI